MNKKGWLKNMSRHSLNVIDKMNETPLIFDGAMGTAIYEKGVFINACYDELNLTRPDLIKSIHQEYVDAGCDVILTNTFGANQFKLEKFGIANKLYDINLRGAEIAREVAGDDIYVLGSIGSCLAKGSSLTVENIDKLKIETRTDEVIVVNCIMTDLDAQSKSDKIELNNIEVDTANLKALDDISIRISGEDDYSYDLTPGIGDEVEMGTNTIEGSYKSESLSGKSITAKAETGDINISFAKK